MYEIRFTRTAEKYMKKLKEKGLKKRWQLVVVILVGTRGNFYDELKGYMK